MAARLFRFDSKMCAFLFLFSMLCLWAIVAWKFGEVNATETIWVAREKITDAEANIPLQQVSVARGLMFGIPVFFVGGLLSVALTELFYAILRFFRGET